jgi:hypothetical protein
MKWLIINILSHVFFLNSSVVDEFHVLTNREDEKHFILKYQDNTDISIQAYVCGIEMKQAEYYSNPFSKLRIFKSTKKKIDLLIEKHPKNIDLRYVRLYLQENTPSILGYNEFIEEDKTFLLRQIELNKVSIALKNHIINNTSL